MLITKILKVRRSRNIYEVFIDEKSALRVSESTLTKSGLFAGKTVDEREVEQITQSDARDRAQQIAVNLISYRPRSTREIADKLSRKGFSEEITRLVIAKLLELNLLDDLAFVRMFVRDKLRGKPMGKAMLRRKLLEKGIAFQLSEDILREYVSDENEQEAATALATRKLKLSRSRLASLDKATRQKRLIDYLLGRGFSREIANKTVRSIIQ